MTSRHTNDLPTSILISPDRPSKTLYNVYNVMDAMSRIMAKKDENCADWGVALMFRECMDAIAWEAERFNNLINEKEEVNHG